MKDNSKIREVLWPIYGQEHKIWLPMALMVGFILFNYTVLRNLKDSLVVTSTGNATILPFLKLLIVLPSSLLFFLFYAKLADLVQRKTLFYIIISIFLGFFVLFGFFLFPFHEYLHPKTSADFLESVLPLGFKGLIDCYRIWTFSLFYVFSELWGVVINGILFWQFANDTISVKNAKRFYPHFYLLANFFVSFSGLIVSEISHKTKSFSASMMIFTIIITFIGIGIIIIYYFLNKNIIKNKNTKKDENIKIPFEESLKHIIKNPYLGLIASLIISYGITANLLELAWKRQISLLYPSPNDYAAFMGHLSTLNGIGTIVCIFLGSYILRKKSWLFAAMLTPLFMGILGSVFFIGVLSPDIFEGIITYFSLNILSFTVFIGLILEVIVKSVKYALFDPTKEMTYIPLDADTKLRGKAAVDLVGSRFGKSGGGMIEIFIIASIGSLTEAIHIFFILFLIVSILWILAVLKLNKLFIKACKPS